MKSYQRLRLWAAAVLLIELAVGLVGLLTPQREIFPFASWFLFSLVPDRVVSYDLVLHGTPDQPLDPPLHFNRAGGLVQSPHSVRVYELVQQLGRATEIHDEAKSRRLRRQIEAQFSKGSAMRYDLVRMRYTPAERWKGRQEAPPAGELVRSFVSEDSGSGQPLPSKAAGQAEARP